MMFLVTSSLFSQESKVKPSLTQQDYLEKSKKLKTAARIFSIGGAALITTGIIIPEGELVYDGNCYWGWCDDEYANDGIKSAFIVSGTFAVLSSIPLFIISGKKKRKAMSVSFKKENTLQMYNQNLVYTSVPALKFRVDF